MTARDMVVGVIRVVLYALFFALVLRQCAGDAITPVASARDPLELQAECFDNTPPLYYDQAGNCFSEDPAGLSVEQRAAVAVTPTARGGPSAPTGPVAPGSTGDGPAPPMAAGPIDPRSPDAAPPPVLLAVPTTTTNAGGTTGGGTDPTAVADGTTAGTAATGGAGQAGTTDGSGPRSPTAVTAEVEPSGEPTSPSLTYIAEDGRTDTVREGPLVNGIQVWVHDPSRTLYADSCEALQAITGLDQEFGPTPEAPGYGSICPQL